jgi:hypothetical protein
MSFCTYVSKVKFYEVELQDQITFAMLSCYTIAYREVSVHTTNRE